MSRSAAARIASRVVLPSRVLAVELRGNVGVLVVVICTNQSVQKLPPVKHCVKPELKERAGIEELRHRETPDTPRSVTAPPGRSEPPRGLRGPFEAPLEEGHGSAGTLPSRPGVKGALLGPLLQLKQRTSH